MIMTPSRTSHPSQQVRFQVELGAVLCVDIRWTALNLDVLEELFKLDSEHTTDSESGPNSESADPKQARKQRGETVMVFVIMIVNGTRMGGVPLSESRGHLSVLSQGPVPAALRQSKLAESDCDPRLRWVGRAQADSDMSGELPVKRSNRAGQCMAQGVLRRCLSAGAYDIQVELVSGMRGGVGRVGSQNQPARVVISSSSSTTTSRPPPSSSSTPSSS